MYKEKFSGHGREPREKYKMAFSNGAAASAAAATAHI